jgi:ubiquinone/menaquinone biosynthesis C-methylase UbiE
VEIENEGEREDREKVLSVKNQPLSNSLSEPFGIEYASRPTWGILERSYIRRFGLLDLPNRLRARIVMPELTTLQPKRVLDLGSGTGCYSFFLSRDNRIDVSGVDIDECRVSESSHIAKCLGRGNLKFYYGSADECLEKFPSGAFEMVLAIEVLQYLTDVPLILREIHRVLTPGGYLLGHLPVLGYLRTQERTLFDNDKIRQMFSRAHFQIMKITPTFGGISQTLCTLYDFLSRLPVLAGALFPFILLASSAFHVDHPKGQYRFFVVQKPAITVERTEE